MATNEARPRSGHRRTRSLLPVHVVLAVGALLMAFPFLWQLLMSVSTSAEVRAIPPSIWPASPQWHNYADVFERLPFFSQFVVTVVITVIRTGAQVITSTLAGYAFARMRFPGRGVILALILATLMVPSQTYLLSQYQIVQALGWLDTVAGIVAPGMFSAFAIFLMYVAFRAIPRELEEAALLDGASPPRTFWSVMLPLVKPSINVVVITTVLWSWNDLLWPLVVSTYDAHMPLAVGLGTLISNKNNVDYPLVMAASTLALVPVIAVFIAFQRRVIEGLSFTGVK